MNFRILGFNVVECQDLAQGDKAWYSANADTIYFKAWTYRVCSNPDGKGEKRPPPQQYLLDTDEITFSLCGYGAGTVTFDLRYGGQAIDPTRIHIGQYAIHPSSVPFTLTGPRVGHNCDQP